MPIFGGEDDGVGIFTGVDLGVTSEATLAVTCEVTFGGELAVDLMLDLRGGGSEWALCAVPRKQEQEVTQY